MLKSKSLQFFVEEVEAALEKGGTSLVLQVCRHITSENPKVSSFMTAKCVEWALGKAKETLMVEGEISHTHDHYEHATDEQLRAAEQSINALIESAQDAGANQK